MRLNGSGDLEIICKKSFIVIFGDVVNRKWLIINITL